MVTKLEQPIGKLTDCHGRRIDYLRLSITDLCNLRCFYCMPGDGVEKLPHSDVLRYEEFLEVVRVAATLGVHKVRITGGEPLIKRGAVKMVREISRLPGIATVVMTTNGTRLEKYAAVLKQAGLARVNVSLDSLDPETYRSITRKGDLNTVLRGIDAALSEGFRVKINTVLVNGFNDRELERFVTYASERGLEVRFIEQMSFETEEPYVSQDDILSSLARNHTLSELGGGNSPHVRLFDCDGMKIGFISPRSRPFCSGCNKLRLMPNGRLRACLASSASVDMRTILRRPHTDMDIARAIRQAVKLKPETGPWTAQSEMWRVGG